MRTVKASEVVKGMRVQFDVDRDGVTYMLTSSVMETPHVGVANCDIHLGTGGRVIETLPNDHPVTVLAEPEPEWVEGAWYWVELQEKRTLMRRVGRGWSALADTDYAFHKDANVTVLGRVLIVDWPGDDVARTLEHWPNGSAPLTEIDKAVYGVADAIRTQGGAR